MSNKRIQVLHGDLDQKALDWLDAQTNMSATIRLMIHQASRGSHDDYVMKCAKESSGIFGSNGSQDSQKPVVPETKPTEPTVNTNNASQTANEPIQAIEPTPTVTNTPDVDSGQEPVKSAVEEVLDPNESNQSNNHVKQEPEQVITQPVEQEKPEPFVSEKPKQSVDWDKLEDEKSDTISRMMADLGRN